MIHVELSKLSSRGNLSVRLGVIDANVLLPRGTSLSSDTMIKFVQNIKGFNGSRSARWEGGLMSVQRLRKCEVYFVTR